MFSLVELLWQCVLHLCGCYLSECSHHCNLVMSRGMLMISTVSRNDCSHFKIANERKMQLMFLRPAIRW